MNQVIIQYLSNMFEKLKYLAGTIMGTFFCVSFMSSCSNQSSHVVAEVVERPNV